MPSEELKPFCEPVERGFLSHSICPWCGETGNFHTYGTDYDDDCMFEETLCETCYGRFTVTYKMSSVSPLSKPTWSNEVE